MKKVKTAIWVIIIAFVALLIYQNRELFIATKNVLVLNLGFKEYKSPELEIVYICFAFFLAGLLLGAYFLVSYGFKTKKRIKLLTAEAQGRQEQIGSLKNQLQTPGAKQALPAAGTSEPEAKTVVITPDEKQPATEKT